MVGQHHQPAEFIILPFTGVYSRVINAGGGLVLDTSLQVLTVMLFKVGLELGYCGGGDKLLQELCENPPVQGGLTHLFIDPWVIRYSRTGNNLAFTC